MGMRVFAPGGLILACSLLWCTGGPHALGPGDAAGVDARGMPPDADSTLLDGGHGELASNDARKGEGRLDDISTSDVGAADWDVGGADSRPPDGAASDVAAECPGPFVPDCGPAASVSVSGAAYVFGPPWGVVSNANVVILEMPERTTTTDDQGNFAFADLPCSDVTFELAAPGFQTTRTETFRLVADLDEVAFQVPTLDLVELLEDIIGVESSPGACHIATTVSVKEMSLINYLVPHGVPGAKVTLCPSSAAPIYFAYISDALILPDIGLMETSPDGGVVFPNVLPGDYVLRAQKEGSVFPDVRVRCDPGTFVNAAPPRGLHEVDVP